jgi:hypothetical protein
VLLALVMKVTHANCDGRKDVLHPLPDFRQPLVLEALAITGLTLEVSVVIEVFDISLIVGL